MNSKLKRVSGAEYRLLQRKGGPEPVWTIQLHDEKGEAVATFRIGAKSARFEQAPAIAKV